MQSTITYCFQPVVQRAKGDSRLIQRNLQAGRLTIVRQKLTSSVGKKINQNKRHRDLKERKLLPKRKRGKKSWVQTGDGSMFKHPQKNY